MNTPQYLDATHHDGSQRYVSCFIPRLGETVSIRVRTAADERIQRVMLRYAPDGEQTFIALTRAESDAVCQWWTIELPIEMPVVHYRFVLLTDDGMWTYNGLGLMEHTPTDYADFRIIADYAGPRWVHHSVFYQIFPDRFADGDPANNVRDGEWEYNGVPTVARNWDEAPGQSHGGLEFYGGDLQGIAQRLDYLAELGVDALYLNPIFTAPSVHRYDVTDYEQSIRISAATQLWQRCGKR